MKQDRLERRMYALEACLPPVKSDMEKFLEKCNVDELRRLKEIIMKAEKLTEAEEHFLADLETRYGPIEEAKE